jgi:hypothetical protein
MKVLGFSILLFTQILNNAFAQYKYVIYTDENPTTKANEVKTLMEGLPPFSEMNMQIEIRSMSTQVLNCAPTPGIDRLVECDNNAITAQAVRDGFDQPLVVSASSNYGGSGGAVPVITSASNVPASMMVHEYMHTLGFCDEYVYSAQDLATYDYCSPQLLTNTPNLVKIEPSRTGYSNDQEARSLHGNQIPWFEHIQAPTPISSVSLGTPLTGASQIGLFPSGMCRNSTRTMHLWKPGSAPNIMDQLSAPIGALEPILREALVSTGLRLRDPSAATRVASPAPVRLVNPEPCDAGVPSILSGEANRNFKDFGDVSDTIDRKVLSPSIKLKVPKPMKN